MKTAGSNFFSCIRIFIGVAFLIFIGCGTASDTDLESAPEVPEEPVRSLSTFPNRSIDGTANNPENLLWGSAGSNLARLEPSAYADGISSPAGAGRSNPREISNQLSFQDHSRPNSQHLSSFVFAWGQFVDHDIDLTLTDPDQSLFIPVPAGDIFFDPEGTGVVEIPFFRSVSDPETGTDETNPRQQVNAVTTWIDGSQIYGSNESRAAWLRTGEGGNLKVSEGNLLPFNDGTQDNAPDNSTDLFVAGDIRANEQAALTAMHTLFVREHNRLCGEIRNQHPEWSDEQIYQRARKWVGALLQAVTFQEFLPALLGIGAVGPYPGYNVETDPSILNEFSTVWYRVGHTMLTEELWRLDENGDPIPEGNLSLSDAFFDTTTILQGGGIDPLLRGLAAQPMEEVDPLMVEPIRSFLFGIPGAGGLDLAALNLQRGRDHGIPDYNSLRTALGLPRVHDFHQISSDGELAQTLAEVYGSVDDVDPWMGALAEDHLRGSSLGASLSAGLLLQFERLRAGDHYWYERDPAFSPAEIDEIRKTRLSDIIRRNTGIRNIPDDVFHVR